MEAGNVFRTLFVVVIGADADVQTHPDTDMCAFRGVTHSSRK